MQISNPLPSRYTRVSPNTHVNNNNNNNNNKISKNFPHQTQEEKNKIYFNYLRVSLIVHYYHWLLLNNTQLNSEFAILFLFFSFLPFVVYIPFLWSRTCWNIWLTCAMTRDLHLIKNYKNKEDIFVNYIL